MIPVIGARTDAAKNAPIPTIAIIPGSKLIKPNCNNATPQQLPSKVPNDKLGAKIPPGILNFYWYGTQVS